MFSTRSTDLAATVVHVPHASTHIPAQVRTTFAINDEQLESELLRMTDWFTDELFDLPGVTRVIYPVSRLVVDPERFESDAQEPMAARGMGAVYTLTSTGEPLRHPLTPGIRQGLIEEYYRPHHQKLTDAVGVALSKHGYCLVIDAHSFASIPLPHEPDQSPDRPDICIGTDRFHTPDCLAAEAQRLFREAGFTVAIDRPFSGSLVPIQYYRSNSSVRSIMIEVNRSSYLQESTGEKLERFTEVAALIQSVLSHLIKGTAIRSCVSRANNSAENASRLFKPQKRT